MKRESWVGAVVFLAACVVGISSAYAEDNGWYIGGGTGETSADVTVGTFNDGGITSGAVDEGGVGWKVFGGYRFLKYFAVEGGFTDLDQVRFEGISDGSGGLYAAGSVNSVYDVNGLFVTAVGILPVAPKVSFFGKAGLLNWDADITITDSSASVSGSDDGSDTMFGLGVEINPTDKFALRAEFEQFSDVVTDDVDRITGNILFRF